MYQLNPDRQLEILRWLIGAQEGQWLMRAAAVYGAPESLKLSSKVRAAQAKAEMKAMLTLVGKAKAEDLADAAKIVETFLHMAYGERGWAGTLKVAATEVGNNGTARLEIDSIRCTPVDNAKKIGQATPEALATVCDALWSGWFEVLLPDYELHVMVQLAGTNGRTTDLFTLNAFDPTFVQTMPIIDLAAPPPPAPSSAIAELLQIPLEPLAQPQLEPLPNPYTSNYQPAKSPIAPTNNYPPTSAPPPNPPTALPEAARPASRLQQAMQKRQNNDSPAPPSVDPLTVPPTPTPVADNTLLYDHKLGRPLFANAEEEEKRAKERADLSKRKNPMIMQKLFLSKQAREMLSDSVDKPQQGDFSLASGIEHILQRLIARELELKPGAIPESVHVMSTSTGIQIRVGDRLYDGVGDMPPGRTRELLQQAVEEWNSQDV